MKQGVLVGLDKELEWLLSWWWENYTRNNSLPVAFCDFGMSDEMRSWCSSKGSLISIKSKPIDENTLSREKKEEFEKIYGKEVWRARKSWFLKPSALLASPFDKTLWLDLDCEVLANLNSLFSSDHDLSLAKEPLYAVEKSAFYKEGITLYNSGVILYKKELSLLKKWEELCKESNRFLGDQEALSMIIEQEKFNVFELSPLYNWRIATGVNPNAYIVHWVGSWGKSYIKKYGGLSPLVSKG